MRKTTKGIYAKQNILTHSRTDVRTLAALTSPSMSLPGRRGRAEVPSLWRDYAVAVYNFSFNLSVQAKREMKQREEREQNKQVRETKIPNLTLIVFRADFAARRSNARTSRCGRQTGPSGPSPAGRWPRVRQRADVPFRAPHRPRWTAACAERPRTFLPAGALGDPQHAAPPRGRAP